MKPATERKPAPEPPAFAFWLEEDHVLVSGNARPKSALMVLRCAAALLAALLEREGNLERVQLIEKRALAMLRADRILVTQGQGERKPDAIVALPRGEEALELAKLLTVSELEKLATVAVQMLVGLNRPGGPAVFLDKRECANMLGMLISAHEGGPDIPWSDPFETEDQKP